MSVQDGGPAFPQHLVETRDGAIQASYDAPDGAGMSLRDYFAAQALKRVTFPPVGYKVGTGEIVPDDAALLAKNCYAIADALLAEREQEKERT